MLPGATAEGEAAASMAPWGIASNRARGLRWGAAQTPNFSIVYDLPGNDAALLLARVTRSSISTVYSILYIVYDLLSLHQRRGGRRRMHPLHQAFRPAEIFLLVRSLRETGKDCDPWTSSRHPSSPRVDRDAQEPHRNPRNIYQYTITLTAWPIRTRSTLQ